MRITALLQKIHELASQADNATAIDIDLMLDYTRVLYSDLLEWRKDAATPRLRENVDMEPHATQSEPAIIPPPTPPPVAAVMPPAPNMNGHEAEGPKPTTPVSAPSSPSVHQTTVQFPMPEAIEPVKPQPAAQVKAEPKELTLEEYLARQRASDAEEPDEEQPVSRTQPSAQPAVASLPVQPAVNAAPTPPQPRDIRTMIGINDKYQIMSELFGNDKAAYEQALDVINRSESEQAAFNWLRERLWVTEDHSDAAMIFFDVVRRFKNG